MKKLCIALVLCTVAVSSAFGQDAGDTKPATGVEQLAGPEVGPEAVAKKLIEATKKGDMDAMLDCSDLKAIYEGGVPLLDPEPDEDLSFEQWEKAFREQTIRDAGDIRRPDLEYQILGTEEEDGVTYVKIKARESKESDWEEVELPFVKVDGEWKCNAERARVSERERELIEEQKKVSEEKRRAYEKRPVSQKVRCDKCGETSPQVTPFKTRGKFQPCPKCGEKAARAIVYWECGNPECNSQLIKVATHVYEDGTFHKSPDKFVCPKCGKPDFIAPMMLLLEYAKEIAEETGQDFP